MNGKYVGASSFANRTRYPIEPGVLKAGVNVIATNIYCGWRDCGIRGPAENRAIRFADSTSVPLSNPWKYQEVSDGSIGPQLPWGSVHGMTLDYNGMISPLGAYTFRGAVWYQGESDVHFAGSYYKATLLGDDGGVAAAVRGSRTAVPSRAVARLRADPDAADCRRPGPACAKRSGKPRWPTSTPRSR